MHQHPSSRYMNMNRNLQFPEEEHLNCPRCDSNNTKFCYYNNYNLSQPRHYCKNCCRYWTKGGTLRRIPIGGASRTKRSSTSTSKLPATSSTTLTPHPQLKPESSEIYSFNDNRCTVSDGRRCNSLGSFVADLGPNLIEGSGSNGLNQTPATEKKDLSVNDDGNQSGSGGNGWPHLSIFRSGFNFGS